MVVKCLGRIIERISLRCMSTLSNTAYFWRRSPSAVIVHSNVRNTAPETKSLPSRRASMYPRRRGVQGGCDSGGTVLARTTSTCPRKRDRERTPADMSSL
jgi:hypothetical protein